MRTEQDIQRAYSRAAKNHVLHYHELSFSQLAEYNGYLNALQYVLED